MVLPVVQSHAGIFMLYPNHWCILAFCLLLAGCACGPIGTQVAWRTLTPTAEVVEVSGLGLLVRPTGCDRGLSFGYRQATYIYPRLAGDKRPGEHLLLWVCAPVRKELPFFLGTREVGVGFQSVAGFSTFHAGFVDQSFSFVARADESRRGSFFYQRSHPERTVLALHTGSGKQFTLNTKP